MNVRAGLLGRKDAETTPDDSLTTFLFANPSFLHGVARALDLGNTLTQHNKSLSPEDADVTALRADVQAVGRDLHAAAARVVAADSVQRRIADRDARGARSHRPVSRRAARAS